MRRIALLLPVALLAIATAAPAGSGPATFAEAKALAAESGKPLLVDFFTDWCGPCKAFDKAVHEDADIQATLEAVVLFKIDAEKGAGIELASTHKVDGYPTYVLMNADGATLDRWSGYGKDYFLEMSSGAFSDLTTIDEKRARFHEHPNASDAAKLARYHETRGDHREAVELFAKAQELGDTNYSFQIFQATAYGVGDEPGAFHVDDARKAADAVLAVPGQEADHIVTTYEMMKWLEGRADRKGLATPYLADAMKAAEGHEGLARAREKLAIDHAVRIEKNGDKAFELKLASMKDGWRDDAGGLNAMAWWCFENEVKLDEAEELARRGVELAEAPGDKANILDTLAEICNARGNCPEAVVYMRQAVELNPQREYFKKQLERFEALAAVSAN
jgi:thiol-disulfide isomerase/thioredoxin